MEQNLRFELGWVVAALLAVAALMPLPLIMGGAATPGQPVLVIAPPWKGGADAIIAASNGTGIGPFSGGAIGVAVFEDLSSVEAWIVRDAGPLLRLCGGSGTLI